MYMPRNFFIYRLRTLIVISLIWIVFGLVFYENLIRKAYDLGVSVSILEFSITFGIIGFIITGTLIFFLKAAFNHLPVWLASIFKFLITVFLFFIIGFLLLLGYFVFRYNRDFDHFIQSFFTKIVQTRTFNIFMIDMGLMTLLSIILLEVMEKYGPGLFWSMLSGEYHRPKIENRIFIFLDMNASTTIAEQLGHEKYFWLLRNFFSDITVSVLANGGEIYQYVGDEMVLSWLNTPENKAHSLKFIRNAYYLLKRREKFYKRRYGIAPEFKVGVHAGEVTAGLIGIIKRDLIYCGDTTNTTSRICSMCSELDESYLLSEDFMNDFQPLQGYHIQEIGKMELKGKQELIKLYALKLES
jgi:adenylate cyclase